MLASRHRDPAFANPLSSLPHLEALRASVALQRQIKTNYKTIKEHLVPV